MPGDPGEFALAGRSNGPTTLYGPNNQPIATIVDGQALPWRPVKLYRQVTDSRDRAVARNSGTLGAAGQGGPTAGTVWDTPSTLDQVTVLSEDATKVYLDPNGKDWTLHDMVLELFKQHQLDTGQVKPT